MKKYFIFGAIVLALVAALAVSLSYSSGIRDRLDVANANLKAYDALLSTEKKQNVAHQLTISQLNYFNDSVLKELNETRKELKVKDKNLKALQSVHSVFTRVDTLVMNDTIFREPSFALDTLIGDEWYSLQLGLKFPSTIAAKPTFKSDKHIVVSVRKETVNPPKKFFLFRWFQRRHEVLRVDVVEKNPYVTDENSRYVEILK